MKKRVRIMPMFMAASLCTAMMPMAAFAEPSSEDESSDSTAWKSYVAIDASVTQNIAGHDYSVYASVVNSYLVDNEDGTFTRVEYVSGTGVLVETVERESGDILSSLTLEMELSKFGGFYSGEEYNFLVFAQDNEEEDDEQEVFRVVKYTKDWERVGSCSICGANTSIPLDEGSLRMAETDGKLYVYSCHSTYTTDDTKNQSNMTFVLNEESMEVEDEYYGVLNISTGYVSHSMNQYIQTDGEYVYRVDHGNCFPRAVTITKVAVGDDITNVDYTTTLEFGGSQVLLNTGASVGGFELSEENCLIVGSSIDQDASEWDVSGQRNIYLTVTDQELESTDLYWLTSYSASDGITVGNPEIVDVGDDQFLILWEETSSSGAVDVSVVLVDGDGNVLSDVVSLDADLSDCQPILTGDGLVAWYVSDGTNVIFYELDPDNLEGLAAEDGEDSEDDDLPEVTDFTDLDEDAWYYDDVCYIIEEGIMEGVSDTRFAPDEEITRGEFVTILYRLQGSPEVEGTSSFTDVEEDQWYTDAVVWAEQAGVAEGYDTGEFGVDDLMTREQMVVFLERYLEKMGEDTSARADLTVYPDYEDVSDWAEESMSWAVAAGVLTGTGENGATYLRPQDTSTRAMAAVVIARYLRS